MREREKVGVWPILREDINWIIIVCPSSIGRAERWACGEFYQVCNRSSCFPHFVSVILLSDDILHNQSLTISQNCFFMNKKMNKVEENSYHSSELLTMFNYNLLSIIQGTGDSDTACSWHNRVGAQVFKLFLLNKTRPGWTSGFLHLLSWKNIFQTRLCMARIWQLHLVFIWFWIFLHIPSKWIIFQELKIPLSRLSSGCSLKLQIFDSTPKTTINKSTIVLPFTGDLGINLHMWIFWILHFH